MKLGDIADNFEAIDQHGVSVTLDGLLEKGRLVLFFYPKAMTSG
jgi:peroxiredoxin Q/BCP